MTATLFTQPYGPVAADSDPSSIVTELTYAAYEAVMFRKDITGHCLCAKSKLLYIPQKLLNERWRYIEEKAKTFASGYTYYYYYFSTPSFATAAFASTFASTTPSDTPALHHNMLN